MQPSPIGSIAAWSGAIVDIPTGWALCNGSNGTPNLRDRFVFGASAGNPVDGTGGASQHNHDFTGDDHWHPLTGTYELQIGDDFDWSLGFSPGVGTTDPTSSLPPYYSLAYIMYTGT